MFTSLEKDACNLVIGSSNFNLIYLV